MAENYRQTNEIFSASRTWVYLVGCLVGCITIIFTREHFFIFYHFKKQFKKANLRKIHCLPILHQPLCNCNLSSSFFTFVLIEVLLRTDGQFVDLIHTAGRWIGDEDVLVCYIIFINHQNMFKSHHLDVTYFPKIDAFKNLQ